jgi:hypothetical protein
MLKSDAKQSHENNSIAKYLLLALDTHDILNLRWGRRSLRQGNFKKTEDPEFEFRQGVRFFRNLYIAVLLS